MLDVIYITDFQSDDDYIRITFKTKQLWQQKT